MEGQYFPDKVVADHLIFLVLAAHDTTTSALTMASYYLARHPEWQERLRGGGGGGAGGVGRVGWTSIRSDMTW